MEKYSIYQLEPSEVIQNPLLNSNGKMRGISNSNRPNFHGHGDHLLTKYSHYRKWYNAKKFQRTGHKTLRRAGNLSYGLMGNTTTDSTSNHATV